MDVSKEWHGMPEFIQEKKEAFRVITFISEVRRLVVRFNNIEDLTSFANKSGRTLVFTKKVISTPVIKSSVLSELFEQKITDKTKSIWYPFKSHWGAQRWVYKTIKPITPEYPIYIVSKGRAENGLTTKTLNDMSVPHFIVVESSEYEKYKLNNEAKILILPKNYLSEYDTCDDLGDSRSKGPGAARNFCLDHSKKNGFKRHWVMDDNIDAFHRLNKNEKCEVETGATLKAAEDFIRRYSNVPVSGFNYYSFCKKNDKVPPFTINTRIYSCLLIDNDAGYRWRGRYNEDTDLSLRVLKDGLCTIQFNAFLCGKTTTQRMKGGNTKEFYDNEGTLPKSKMIEDLHPDVAKVVWRFNRWHHHVDYKSFKSNKLIRVVCCEPSDVDDYGFILEPKK